MTHLRNVTGIRVVLYDVVQLMTPTPPVVREIKVRDKFRVTDQEGSRNLNWEERDEGPMKPSSTVHEYQSPGQVNNGGTLPTILRGFSPL